MSNYLWLKKASLFHCIKEMTKIIKNLIFLYIKVHWYNYVTGLVTRQILFDKYNSMISLSEMYTAFPFFCVCKLSYHGLSAF